MEGWHSIVHGLSVICEGIKAISGDDVSSQDWLQNDDLLKLYKMSQNSEAKTCLLKIAASLHTYEAGRKLCEQ